MGAGGLIRILVADSEALLGLSYHQKQSKQSKTIMWARIDQEFRIMYANMLSLSSI